MNEWNASRDHRERIYISYDATNKSCQAGDITIAEFGHSKEGQDDEVFMLGRERADVISRELRLCGYFCIVTSAKMTAKEALELYKSRDASEKLFRGDKTYLGNKSIRVHSD